ncbi:hypothetical protein IQ268_25180 [Oculatella sp. LEGE 06141]|uniref:DUF6679 family protein n=1 Tax=Oculatella sp. LEGE 06141 TaxID=1828648 RepID=UPI001881AB86|nr:DUF6679 family protein [Oculatella sp. LEGE 06141]MBE9181866.1 hypothetical protein [Oculatella sp. LEGE 06141]
MKEKLKELVGQSNVWLFIKSSNGWVKNAEILDVTAKTVTFRYEHETESEHRVWEKTTRINNIAEIEIKLLAVPRESKQMSDLQDRLTNLLEKE